MRTRRTYIYQVYHAVPLWYSSPRGVDRALKLPPPKHAVADAKSTVFAASFGVIFFSRGPKGVYSDDRCWRDAIVCFLGGRGALEPRTHPVMKRLASLLTRVPILKQTLPRYFQQAMCVHITEKKRYYRKNAKKTNTTGFLGEGGTRITKQELQTRTACSTATVASSRRLAKYRAPRVRIRLSASVDAGLVQQSVMRRSRNRPCDRGKSGRTRQQRRSSQKHTPSTITIHSWED